MKIAIAGGSGFVGEPLVRRLVSRGDDVVVLSRSPAKVRAGRGVQWDGQSQGAWTADVASADVVVNLAGENIGDGRWTAERKRRLIDSRLNATRALVQALGSAIDTEPTPRRAFISASAVGYYGLRGDESLTESASRGTGFLADLVARWEEEARHAEKAARLVILRFGVVLAGDGGALAKMLLPFKLGVGGRIGSGQQWMSWVSRDDLIRMIEWAIGKDSARGIYNVTSPVPVRNVDFTKALGHALHRPTIFPIPGFVLKAAFGEMADEVLLGGQRVIPARAMEEGFVFSHLPIEPALKHALGA
ncbi:MAG: TIGR01777 family oxidoreductase [Thermoanaerobaculia bacterium]